MRKLSLLVALAALVCACGSAKPKSVSVPQTNNEVELTLPCGEFFTDKDFFRGTGIGQSRDMNTAREKARMAANAELASSISVVTKRVAERYVNDAGQSVDDYAETFESLTREKVSQELSNVRTACSKVTKTPEGLYKCYMSLEAARGEVFEAVDRAAKGNAKINTLYDREKFREIYNSEMEKM